MPQGRAGAGLSLGHPSALPQRALPESRPGDAQHKEVTPSQVTHCKQPPVRALLTDQQGRGNKKPGYLVWLPSSDQLASHQELLPADVLPDDNWQEKLIFLACDPYAPENLLRGSHPESSSETPSRSSLRSSAPRMNAPTCSFCSTPSLGRSLPPTNRPALTSLKTPRDID